jgi:hypothetical protein
MTRQDSCVTKYDYSMSEAIYNNLMIRKIYVENDNFKIYGISVNIPIKGCLWLCQRHDQLPGHSMYNNIDDMKYICRTM